MQTFALKPREKNCEWEQKEGRENKEGKLLINIIFYSCASHHQNPKGADAGYVGLNKLRYVLIDEWLSI